MGTVYPRWLVPSISTQALTDSPYHYFCNCKSVSWPQVGPEARDMTRMVENEEMEGVGMGEACALVLQPAPGTCVLASRRNRHVSRTPAEVATGQQDSCRGGATSAGLLPRWGHVSRTPAEVATECPQKQWLLLWTICTLVVFWHCLLLSPTRLQSVLKSHLQTTAEEVVAASQNEIL